MRVSSIIALQRPNHGVIWISQAVTFSIVHCTKPIHLSFCSTVTKASRPLSSQSCNIEYKSHLKANSLKVNIKLGHWLNHCQVMFRFDCVLVSYWYKLFVATGMLLAYLKALLTEFGLTCMKNSWLWTCIQWGGVAFGKSEEAQEAIRQRHIRQYAGKTWTE